MKCISKIGICGFLITSMLLCGCGAPFDYDFSKGKEIGAFDPVTFKEESKVTPFASNLCISDGDYTPETVDMESATCAELYDVKNKKTLYSKNAHERMNPASLTKVMTALIALKNCSLDEVITATNNVIITEKGAQLCGLKPGDSMTMEQALHVLLMYSANDAAVMIAEHVAGNVAAFCTMMNEEAKSLGATNTNFTNPHGLTDENHYTSAYDLYLMFQEAIKYDKFVEIIHMSSYQTTYYDKNGKAKELNFESTNRYIKGTVSMPDNVNVIGGKTGTTAAAGHCLMLLSKDRNGDSYISVVLQSSDYDSLYNGMTDLLDEINK